jgi:hypothetical protein
MMAYDSQFVLAILHEGSPVREINGKITIPFGSEYIVRLKNKSNVRAKARVWIDGRKASTLGDFILHAGETLDLERFLDESMDSGRRFKFVHVSDSRVNDPTDYNNGVVKVEFYKETSFRIDWGKINLDPYRDASPFPYDNRKGSGADPNFLRSTHISWNDNSTLVSNSIASSSICDSNQLGATVEGGNSDQRFVEGQEFSTEALPITLSLKIQGPRIKTPSTITKPRPTSKPRVRFCSNCGTRRRRSARFCSHCGEAFRRR